MRSFEFRHIAKIRGKGRPRVVKGRAYTPKQTQVYERDLALAGLSCRQGQGLIEAGQPVCLRIKCLYKRPDRARALGLCLGGGSRPDLDNVCKLVSDSLNGVLYADDRQIVRLYAEQAYAPPGAPEALIVNVSELKEP